MEIAKNNVVELKNIRKKYSGVEALKGINVDIPAGKITGLIGPNGSGKSTMLKIIAGLTQATGGKLEVFGKKLDYNLKDQIAFLPEINHFYDWMTIAEIINFTNTQFSNFDSEKASDITDFMNLNSEMKIKNLSKGMVGRVKLILAMSRNVPLIIMDEPLAGIDPKSRAQILESLINEYNAKTQSIILSTHEVLEAEKFFDYAIFLENGKIKLEGNADDLRKEKNKSIQDISKEVFI